MIISDTPSAAYSWMKHIRGTAALMRVVQLPTTNMVFAMVGCLQVAFTVVRHQFNSIDDFHLSMRAWLTVAGCRMSHRQPTSPSIYNHPDKILPK